MKHWKLIFAAGLLSLLLATPAYAATSDPDPPDPVESEIGYEDTGPIFTEEELEALLEAHEAETAAELARIEEEESVDLIAEYLEENPVEVVQTLDEDTGQLTETVITPEEAYTFTVTDYIPEKDGYHFLGWSDRKGDTRPKYFAGDEITVYADAPDLQLYAVWEEIEAAEEPPEETPEPEPHEHSYAAPVWTWEAAEDGWTVTARFVCEDAGCGDERTAETRVEVPDDEEADVLTALAEGPDGETVFISTRIAFAPAETDGEAYAAYLSGTLAEDGAVRYETAALAPGEAAPVELLPAEPEETEDGGYLLTFTAPEDEEDEEKSVLALTVYAERDGEANGLYSAVLVLNEDTELTAEWTAEPAPEASAEPQEPAEPEKEGYLLRYDGNGADADTVPEGETGTVLTVSETVPAREGYDFLGWVVRETEDETRYQPGDAIALTSDTTLYALWMAKRYTVSYYAGPADAEPCGTETLLSDQFVIIAGPEREGYTFLGWEIMDAVRAEDVGLLAEGSVFRIENGMTEVKFYAVWAADPPAETDAADGDQDVGTTEAEVPNTEPEASPEETPAPAAPETGDETGAPPDGDSGAEETAAAEDGGVTESEDGGVTEIEEEETPLIGLPRVVAIVEKDGDGGFAKSESAQLAAALGALMLGAGGLLSAKLGDNAENS